jgi:serine/threonine protein kinase
MFGEFPGYPGYKIERVLGRGATAQVFAATRNSDGLLVALKVFHPGLWDQADLRRRAKGEFKTVSSLDHPNILRVVEPLWENPNPAVALEFVDGTSLEEFQARLPYILPEVAVLILLEVLAALDYAHAQGVIHRDLKPANILISREGRVVVSDFGLAKMRDVSRLTLSGTVLGSPDYMSPEQARGEATTERSDLFAAAAVLYFLVTGTRPFSRRTPLATLAAVSEAQAEPASQRNPKLSPALARILSRGLSKNPGDRFASAAVFKQALQDYLAELGLNSPDLFTLPYWLQAPTDTSLEALKTIADQLVLNIEALVAEGAFDEATDRLSHLAQVAPESAALPRLMQELDARRRNALRDRGLQFQHTHTHLLHHFEELVLRQVHVDVPHVVVVLPLIVLVVTVVLSDGASAKRRDPRCHSVVEVGDGQRDGVGRG